jgi:hypothetical protein|tara:strand:+ start:2608 stop:3093 length:486 start_codon:yes stop_codon:yes gene_type:complete
MSLKYNIASLVAGTLISAPLGSSAQLQYPYTCVWNSQINSNAKIQFTSTNGIGGFQGAVYYGGMLVINFREGNYQGYGSNWWTPTVQGANNPGGGEIIIFKDGEPSRSTASRQQISEIKLLTVGLGSMLYYGGHRDKMALIQAAEGFWVPSKGCRHIDGRY